MSKAITFNNWYNEPNYLTKGITEISHKTYWKKIYSQKAFLALERINYLKSLMNDVIRIEFPYDIKGILNDVIRIDFNGEYQEYIPIIEELHEENLISMLNYKTQYLFDVINTYDKYVFEHPNKHKILSEVFKLTHSINTRLSKEKMNAWIENFPNMIDRKIEILKKKNKKKNRSPKQLAYDKSFNSRPSELRKLNIIRYMNSIGWYGFKEDQIFHWMEIGLKDDEIYKNILDSIEDEFGNDEDTIEIDESKFLSEEREKEEYYLEKEKEQFIDYLIKNNIKWRVSWN